VVGDSIMRNWVSKGESWRMTGPRPVRSLYGRTPSPPSRRTIPGPAPTRRGCHTAEVTGESPPAPSTSRSAATGAARPHPPPQDTHPGHPNQQGAAHPEPPAPGPGRPQLSAPRRTASPRNRSAKTDYHATTGTRGLDRSDQLALRVTIGRPLVGGARYRMRSDRSRTCVISAPNGVRVRATWPSVDPWTRVTAGLRHRRTGRAQASVLAGVLHADRTDHLLELQWERTSFGHVNDVSGRGSERNS